MAGRLTYALVSTPDHDGPHFHVQDDGKVEWRDSGGDPGVPMLLCLDGMR